MEPPTLNVTKEGEGYSLQWEEINKIQKGLEFEVQYRKDTASWEVSAWLRGRQGRGREPPRRTLPLGLATEVTGQESTSVKTVVAVPSLGVEPRLREGM